MATPPDGLTLRHDRDLEGRGWHDWARRALIALVGLAVAFGLLNVFGQRPSTSTAASPAASLKIVSPARVRSGLIFQSRFHIHANREVRKATLVLDPGWLEGMTLNTVEPAPIGEASRDGRIAFELGRVPAGDDYLLFLQFQVNPTNVGRRSNDVELYDGERLLLRIDRTITVWP
jgi:hypothetical protein